MCLVAAWYLLATINSVVLLAIDGKPLSPPLSSCLQIKLKRQQKTCTLITEVIGYRAPAFTELYPDSYTVMALLTLRRKVSWGFWEPQLKACRFWRHAHGERCAKYKCFLVCHVHCQDWVDGKHLIFDHMKDEHLWTQQRPARSPISFLFSHGNWWHLTPNPPPKCTWE